MSFAAWWFWPLYLSAAGIGAFALATRTQFAPRQAWLTAAFVAFAAGIAAGISLRGTWSDVSGEPFVVPPPAAEIPSIAAVPAPPIGGREATVTVDVFASSHAQAGAPPVLKLQRDDSLVVIGWALDDRRVPCHEVDIIVDARAYAALAQDRSDVANVYGPSALQSGYRAVIPVPALGLGKHRVRVACVTPSSDRATASATRILEATE